MVRKTKIHQEYIKMANKLTIKQRAFAKEYIKNKGNGRQAIKIAYPNITTDNARDVMASKLVRNNKVNSMIDKELEKEGLSKDFVVTETKKVLASCEHARDKLTALRLLGDLGGYTKHNQTIIQQGMGLFEMLDKDKEQLMGYLKEADDIKETRNIVDCKKEDQKAE